MAERTKAAVSKTVGPVYRSPGFKSQSLRKESEIYSISDLLRFQGLLAMWRLFPFADGLVG